MRKLIPILLIGTLALAASPSKYSKIVKSSERRARIAVIDTGLDLTDPRFRDVLCSDGHLDLTGQRMYDRNGHGTHVAGIIAEHLNDKTKVCLMIIKYYTASQTGRVNLIKEVQAIEHATRYGAKIMNLSLDGPESDLDEKYAIAGSSATFVVAAGNEDKQYLGYSYPGSYRLPNIKVVGNWDCKNQKKGFKANYGDDVIWRCGTDIESTAPGGGRVKMSGSSMAAPLLTAELANKL